MKFLHKFIKFCQDNQWLSIGSGVFSLISVMALWKTDDPWFMVPMFMGLGVIFIGTFRTVLVALLCSVLIVPGQAKEPQQAMAGPVVAGVCVVVVGGAFTIWAIKYCQKHFNKPKSTNDTELAFSLSGEDDYAASQLYQDAYCPQDLTGDSGPPGATLTTMQVNVTESSVWLSDIRQVPQGSAANYAEFKGELLRLGLDYSAGVHYARNGLPAQPWEVPVGFAERGVIPHVIHGDGTVRTIIEWSPDLERWYPRMTNSTGILRFQFNDVSDTPCGFWRVTRL